MLKEETYQKKFEILEPWIVPILNCIKKEVKNEHLRKEYQFVQKYFTKKSIEKLTIEEISQAYLQEIKEGNEEIGEWVTSRYVIKKADVYHFFAQKLSQINPKFDEIEVIADDKAPLLIEQAVSEFGAVTAYIFSILNSVMFSQHHYQQLRERALKELTENSEKTSDEVSGELSGEALRKKYEEQLLKVSDKYEKKLLGLQRKYTQDVEGLKKQIAQLQRKLQESCARSG